MNFTRSFIKLAQDHYPEIVSSVLLVNTPVMLYVMCTLLLRSMIFIFDMICGFPAPQWIFNAAYKLVKPLLKRELLYKIAIAAPGEATARALIQRIAPEHVPVYLGGFV